MAWPQTDRGGDLDGVSNVLVLAPSMSPDDDETCIDLLSVREAPSVLVVSIVQAPERRLALWDRYDAEPPAAIVFVTVDEGARSDGLGSPRGPTGPGAGPPLGVHPVSGPGDLTGIGIAITTHLHDWRRSERDIALCVHSLTTLLQYADRDRVYRFLHVITNRVAAAGGIAHYHLDRAAHDDETVLTLLTLFDASVEIDEGGTRTVRRR